MPAPPPFPTLTLAVGRQWRGQVVAPPAVNGGLATFGSPALPPVDEVGWRRQPIYHRCRPRRRGAPRPAKECGCLGPGPPSKVLLLYGREVAVEAEPECCVLCFFSPSRKEDLRNTPPCRKWLIQILLTAHSLQSTVPL